MCMVVVDYLIALHVHIRPTQHPLWRHHPHATQLRLPDLRAVHFVTHRRIERVRTFLVVTELLFAPQPA